MAAAVRFHLTRISLPVLYCISADSSYDTDELTSQGGHSTLLRGSREREFSEVPGQPRPRVAKPPRHDPQTSIARVRRFGAASGATGERRRECLCGAATEDSGIA